VDNIVTWRFAFGGVWTPLEINLPIRMVVTLHAARNSHSLMCATFCLFAAQAQKEKTDME